MDGGRIRQLDNWAPWRTEPARTILPTKIAAINAGFAGRVKLRVLHMEGLDPLMVEINELQIVELLQDEVARVVKNIRPRMAIDLF